MYKYETNTQQHIAHNSQSQGVKKVLTSYQKRFYNNYFITHETHLCQ